MTTRLRQDLRWITREGSSYCVMAGAGESSLSPFVLAAGHSALASGQITTVPLFLGALLQNLAPWALGKVGSVRRWSVAMVTLQALCLLALGLGSTWTSLPLWVIFSLVSLYWAAGWSVGPAWNTWMDSVVPSRLRARFFSQRNAFCQFVQWTTMMTASGVLALGQKSGVALPVFNLLFTLAGCARLLGAYCMSRQSEPLPLPQNYRVLGLESAVRLILDSPKARPLVYMLGAQLSLNLAAPFLVPYLAQQRHLGYGSLMLCLSAATFSKIFVLPRLGRIAHRLGPRRLFQASGVGLALVPLLWLLAPQSLLACLLVQGFTGVCLAAYDLGVTLVYLEAIPAAERTSVLTRFSIFNTLAMMLGSSLGALWLWSLPGAYAGLFLLAGLARLGALQLLSQSGSFTIAGASPMSEPAVGPLRLSHFVLRTRTRLARRRDRSLRRASQREGMRPPRE